MSRLDQSCNFIYIKGSDLGKASRNSGNAPKESRSRNVYKNRRKTESEVISQDDAGSGRIMETRRTFDEENIDYNDEDDNQVVVTVTGSIDSVYVQESLNSNSRVQINDEYAESKTNSRSYKYKSSSRREINERSASVPAQRDILRSNMR
jgi:hypothetical protein